MARTRSAGGTSPASKRPERSALPELPAEAAEAADAAGDAGAEALARRVADRVRRLRKERGLSLDQLAALSGVSRAALSQIESARTNPTLGILWKAAVGLGVPFQVLLAAEEATPVLVSRASTALAVRSADGLSESRLLSPGGANQRIEVYELRFRSRAVLRSEPHGAGTTETVLVLAGALRVTVGDAEHDLEPGDAVFFHADVAHSYANPGREPARCLDVVAYPNPPGANPPGAA
jgi:transcriptional regulator with XRE-family HTH domain